MLLKCMLLPNSNEMTSPSLIKTRWWKGHEFKICKMHV